MDKITKLLRKIPKKDRILIEETLKKLFKRKLDNLDIQKLKGYQYIFRLRVGNYRIFYYDDHAKIMLKAIKRRNEATYSNF